MTRLIALGLIVALAAGAEAAEVVRVRAGAHADFARIVFDWPRPVGHEARIADGALIVRFAEPFEADFAEVLKRLRDTVAEVTRPDANSARFVLRRPAGVRQSRNQGSIVVDVTTAAAAPPPPPAPPPLPSRAAAPIAQAAPAPLLRLPPASPPPPAPSEARSVPTAGAVSLGITEAEHAAVFRRGERLWLVFDASTRLDLDALTRELGPRVEAVEQLPLPGATVMALVTAPSVGARLARAESGWTVTLTAETRPAAPALTVEARADGGGRVRISGAELGAPMRITDPQIGDVLWVVPVAAPGRGLDRRQRFADFELLPSLQGLVLEQRSDGLKLAVEKGAAVIGAEDGLRLSTDADRRQKPVGMPGMRERLFGAVQAAGADDYNETKWRRQVAILAASGEARRRARVDLARFQLANGFGADALGVLELQQEEFKDSARDPLFVLMRGVARLLDGDFPDAAADLKSPALFADEEAALWRSALFAAEGDFAKAAQGFADGANYLAAYPPAIRQKLLFAAAEAGLNVGDAAAASEWLTELAALTPEAALADRLEVMRGRLKALEGDADAALTIWDAVQDRPSQRARAEAEYARIELLLAKGALSNADAIGRFDRLRFAWRGDEFELAVLARLGELRLAAGYVRDGLLTLKSAAQLFPDSARIPALTESMRTSFRALFADDAAGTLSPLTAIALYEEFRELVPAGAEGDRMIEALVERLVQVDLLDKAAALLEHQIGFRVVGAERARLGARLAEIRLMLGEAGAALTALDGSRAEPLDPTLAGRRRLLAARALAQLGRSPEALALVTEADGPAGLRLKAAIEWQARAWPEAAASLRALIGTPPASGEAVTDERARDIIGHVLALYLAGDAEGLRAARRDFAPAMAGTGYADEFRVYSGEFGPVKDVAELRRRVSDVDLFKSLGSGRPAAKPAN